MKLNVNQKIGRSEPKTRERPDLCVHRSLRTRICVCTLLPVEGVEPSKIGSPPTSLHRKQSDSDVCWSRAPLVYSSTLPSLWSFMKLPLFTVAMMFSMQRTAAFTVQRVVRSQSRAISSTLLRFAEEGQAEVVLIGCGAPNRGAFLMFEAFAEFCVLFCGNCL